MLLSYVNTGNTHNPGANSNVSTHAIDNAVSEIMHVLYGIDFCTSWADAGPLIQQFNISLSAPDSPVHRHGGTNPGWGTSNSWGATSYSSRLPSGKRVITYHKDSALIAAMWFVVCLHDHPLSRHA